MDTKTYIESGVIENFVLGTASQEESSILGCVISHNNEVKSAIVEMQETVEMLADANAIEAPAELKSQIFGKLDFKNKSEEVQTESKEVPQTIGVGKDKVEEKFDIGKKSSATTWLAAASVILLMAFAWNMYRMQQMEQSLVASKAETAKNQQQVDYLANQNKVILHSKNIKLNGVEQHQGMLANIFWDEAYIVHLSVENLPAAPQGKQYQLWAIVDGKPVDVGIYSEANGKMQEMKVIKSAQAFAITLEKEGGSETPTMEEMYVMGEV